MAIDSLKKRQSALGFGQILTVPFPTGSVDSFQMASTLGLYGGIAATATGRLQVDWDYETGHSRTISVITRTDTINVLTGE